MLEQGETAYGAGNKRVDIAMADELRAGIGATASRTATATKASTNVGQLVLLRPIGAAAPPPGVPGAPQALAAVGGSNVVHLSWSPPASDGGSAVASYRIYRGLTSGSEVELTTTASPATTFDDTTSLNGTTYYYKVTAINAVGEGPLSTEASATPAAGPTTPGAPALNSATGGAGGIDLSWTAPTNNGGSAITGYKVYRGTASGTYGPLTTLGNVTTYRDTGATPGTTYYYVVAAVNAIGEGAKSNERSAVASAANVPGAPQALAASAAKGKGITLAWQAPSSNGGLPITGYRIYRSTTAGGTRTLIQTVSGTSYKDATTTRGTTYFYVVTALNSAGESQPSNEASATAR